MARAFNNAVTAIYKGDGAATEAFTLLKTTKIDGNPQQTIDKYFSSGDVSSGVAQESVALGVVGLDIEIECIMFSDGAATPAIVANTITIANGENAPFYQNFVIKRADATMTKAEYLVHGVKVYQGETGKGAARVTATLTRNGAPSTYSGSVS